MAEEPPMVNAKLTVHTSSREIFRLDLGQMKQDQIENLNGLVASAFVVGPSKNLAIRDAQEKDWHFNSEHIVCVEIEVS